MVSAAATEERQVPQSEISEPTAEGLGRLSYFFVILAIFFFSALCHALTWFGWLSYWNLEFGSERAGELGQQLLFVFGPVVLIMWLIASSLRLRNMGFSPGWMLLDFVPLVNLVFRAGMLAIPANFKYHGRMDSTGERIIWVFSIPAVLFALATLGGIFFLILQFFAPYFGLSLGSE